MLDPITVAGIIGGSVLGSGLVGPCSPQLCMALTNAICTYGKTITVTTVDVGTAGAGKGTGVGLAVPVPAFYASLLGFLPANGIAGISMPQIALSVASGYSSTLGTALINTVHTSVGNGVGKVQLVPNVLVAIEIFVQAFASAGLVGVMSAPLAIAIANALNSVLPSAQGIVFIVGSPSNIAATGVGLGSLV